ncbi:ATP-dependent DNA helicase [Bacillus alkalicellulosilyticus]|uniref:ATP-dependent DNA helicase n=1 Tax=Alkalihalobacterium alkalicellulosilyticum TaxID=1912214 RepID=UPI000997ACCD|nr:ATP-dependent DNA helicase [Bacillus alkalicellulosilyticus]
MKTTLPFSISKTENFFDRLGDYVGDVFYDILPDQGYELRDEQIFMAFQLEHAFKHKSTIFAEAGVGTGKTFVYLLYAICYARYMRKPAIISCADETLIEQLVKKGGDIEKLEKALNLKVDVRLAKAREQYVCVKKLDDYFGNSDDDHTLRVHENIPSFVYNSSASMSSFSRYGDRKEYPWVPNDIWQHLAWDPLQQCSTCDFRHRCGQTLNRNYYREAVDLVVCSHDFYMEHVWTKESRKREGQIPLLPEASCVVFDEGHLLEFSAQKALTYRFHAETLTNVLTGYMNQNVREESLFVIEDILQLHDEWFDLLKSTAKRVEGSERREVPFSESMMKVVNILDDKVHQLLEQLVFDSELYTIEEYQVKIIEEYLEFFSYGLSILKKEDQAIYWLEETDKDTTFVILPRLVEDVLKKEVFSQNIPFVFSSATMSRAGDFTYISKSLGIENYTSFTVASPFDYDQQMKINGHIQKTEDEKWKNIYSELQKWGGKSLVLFPSLEEMARFRLWSEKETMELNVLYEGDQEISEIVKEFQENEASILCSYHLWEGLDVPGQSLSQVIISSLPFPPKDPVFEAKRNYAKNSIEEVDTPYMLLRLRQGLGRLIRTSTDHGIAHLWLTDLEKEMYIDEIEKILPVPLSWK